MENENNEPASICLNAEKNDGEDTFKTQQQQDESVDQQDGTGVEARMWAQAQEFDCYED
jgi:hypothetical protein